MLTKHGRLWARMRVKEIRAELDRLEMDALAYEALIDFLAPQQE